MHRDALVIRVLAIRGQVVNASRSIVYGLWYVVYRLRLLHLPKVLLQALDLNKLAVLECLETVLREGPVDNVEVVVTKLLLGLGQVRASDDTWPSVCRAGFRVCA